MQVDRTDADLVAALAARDASALEALYERYGRLAFSLAVRIVGSPETAEEIVQEAFLSIWRGAATYQPNRAAVRTWLLSITHHRAVDAVRRWSARVQTAPLEDQPQLVGGQDVWADVSASLVREEVRSALSQLPEEQRQSIELAYFGGLTYPEVAEKLGVPLGTVKSRLRLGLQKLQSLLENPNLRADPS
ncbi:MAG TPA: sigma-70 family RNA polymerase sigma factor [Dehalococcoidia bacterium]